MDGPERAANPEKAQAILLEAPRCALAGPGEILLVRSGKLPGLFPTRTGPAGEAVEMALRDRLLDVVRREEKGKVVHEWVRLAPAGVEFLHIHESPRAVLAELREALAVSRAGVPVWLEELRLDLIAVGARLAGEVQAMTRQLDALTQRVEAALRRADAAGPGWPEGTETVPWALAALAYLDKRRAAGPAAECPLPELFAAVQRRYSDLTIAAFQDGLRQLAEFKALRLSPHPGGAAAIPEPEYAIPHGAGFLYFAAR